LPEPLIELEICVVFLQVEVGDERNFADFDSDFSLVGASF